MSDRSALPPSRSSISTARSPIRCPVLLTAARRTSAARFDIPGAAGLEIDEMRGLSAREIVRAARLPGMEAAAHRGPCCIVPAAESRHRASSATPTRRCGRLHAQGMRARRGELERRGGGAPRARPPERRADRRVQLRGEAVRQGLRLPRRGPPRPRRGRADHLHRRRDPRRPKRLPRGRPRPSARCRGATTRAEALARTAPESRSSPRWRRSWDVVGARVG